MLSIASKLSARFYLLTLLLIFGCGLQTKVHALNYSWYGSSESYSSPDALCDAYVEPLFHCGLNNGGFCNYGAGESVSNRHTYLEEQSAPSIYAVTEVDVSLNGGRVDRYFKCRTSYTRTYSDGSSVDTYNDNPRNAAIMHITNDKYLLAIDDVDFEPLGCPGYQVKVYNPINTASGNKYQKESFPILSSSSGEQFAYGYNSKSNSAAGDIGNKWSHQYSHSITYYPAISYSALPSGVSASSQFTTADQACTAGWEELKPSFSQYSWAASSYADYLGGRRCAVKKNGGSIWKIFLITHYVQDTYEEPSYIILHRPDGSIRKFVGGYNNGERYSNWIGTWRATNGSKEVVSTVYDAYNDPSGYSYTNPGRASELYDINGKLISITSLDGGVKSFGYANGLLASITDKFSRNITLEYDTNNRINKVIAEVDPQTGNEISSYTFAYDEVGNLKSVTYPDGSIRSYLYEDGSFPSHLTGIIDENSDRYATWVYDTSGRGVLSEHAGGANRGTVAYNADGTTTSTDASGQTVTYHYETINGVKRIVQIEGGFCQACGGGNHATTYDTNGNKDTVTDFNGNITDYDYDLTRNLEIKRTEAVGTANERVVFTEWHPSYRLKTCVIEPKRTVMLDYYSDAMLQTRTEVDTSNATLFPDDASKKCAAIKARGDFATLNTRAWNYTYNDNNQIATVDGPRTDVADITTYAHDAVNGNLQSVTNALNHTTTITNHDASGRPLRTVDANGLVTQLTYTTRGWTDLIKVGTDTVYETTDLDYDNVGQLIKVTLPDGSYLSYTYDAAHRLTDIHDQLGNHIHYTLDAMGNRTNTQVKDPSGALKRTHSNVYNTLNQLSQSIGADKGPNTHIVYYDEYDQNGNLKKMRDAQGNITQYSYDAFDRLSTVLDALNGTTTYQYDVMGNLDSVTDPRGITTQYQYDGLGNLTQLNSPDTGITQYTEYDGAGNLKSQTDARGKTTLYSYDALNRLSTITYQDGSTTVYGYDDATANAIGRLSSITDISGSTQFTYDLRGRIDTKTQMIGTLSLVTDYDYNSKGQLERVTYPSHTVIGYGYSEGQLNQITVDGQVLVNNISYDPFGPVTGWSWGNSTADDVRRIYDQDGALDNYNLAGIDKRLIYSSTGNITAIWELGNTANDKNYVYDAIYRLTNFDGPVAGVNQSHIYGYDANGNRNELTINGQHWTNAVADSSNRMANIKGIAHTYDAVGNIANDGNYNYYYDDRNRLVSVGNGYATYDYNGLGQRVIKQAAAASTLFVYDEQGRLIGEYDAQGNVIQETIFLGALPVLVIKDGTNNWQGMYTKGGEALSLTESSSSVLLSPGDLDIDKSYFAFRKISSDGGISVNTGTLQGSTHGTEVGIEIRESNAPDASYLRVAHFAQRKLILITDDIITPILLPQEDAIHVTFKDSQGNVNKTEYAFSDQTYLKTEVMGSNVGVYASTDGQTWTQLGAQTIMDISQDSVVGFAVSGLANDAEVQLSSIEVTGSVYELPRHYHIYSDHLATPRAITDNVANLIWSWDSDPFGSNAANDDVDGDGNAFVYNLRFPGQYFDEETGLHYNYFRDYDPSTGRYVQSDPIGLRGGLNTYAYIDSNAINWVDPFGLRRSNGRFIPYRSRYQADRWTYAYGREYYRLDPVQNMVPANNSTVWLFELIENNLPMPWDVAKYNFYDDLNKLQSCQMVCNQSGTGSLKGGSWMCNKKGESVYIPEAPSCRIECK